MNAGAIRQRSARIAEIIVGATQDGDLQAMHGLHGAIPAEGLAIYAALRQFEEREVSKELFQ